MKRNAVILTAKIARRNLAEFIYTQIENDYTFYFYPTLKIINTLFERLKQASIAVRMTAFQYVAVRMTAFLFLNAKEKK